MEKAAIILAGGVSKRFGQDKGLLKLANMPLFLHVLERVSPVVDEILVVVGSKSQVEDYAHFVESKVKIVVDKYETRSPLVGALSGFENTCSEYSLLLPCDTPFVSSQIASLLLDLCVDKDAVIPRWPNRDLEPLQATYYTESALAAATEALENKKRSMRSMIDGLEKVSYVSTIFLKQKDTELMTFFNINTPKDLRRAENMFLNVVQPRTTSYQKQKNSRL